MKTTQQKLLFERPKETQQQRCQRVLAGAPKGKAQRASRLFDYREASRIAAGGDAKGIPAREHTNRGANA